MTMTNQLELKLDLMKPVTPGEVELRLICYGMLQLINDLNNRLEARLQ